MHLLLQAVYQMFFSQISCCREGNSAELLAIKASSSGFDNKTCNSLEHAGAAPLTGFCLSTSRSIAGCTFMGPKTIILSNHGCTSLHKIHVHLWSHYSITSCKYPAWHGLRQPCRRAQTLLWRTPSRGTVAAIFPCFACAAVCAFYL